MGMIIVQMALDPMVKEKLLADRQKLLTELNSSEGQGDLDFLK